MPKFLTQHFTLDELIRSETARSRGLDNAPSIAEIKNLAKLGETLEVARYLLQGPLTIHSGFRSDVLNRAVGGAPGSDHRKGLAGDFIPPATRDLIDNYEILKRAMVEGFLRADQIIVYPRRGHIHLGIGPRMRAMAWIEGE